MKYSVSYKTDRYFQRDGSLQRVEEGGVVIVEGDTRVQAFIAAYEQLTAKGLLVCTVNPELRVLPMGASTLTSEELQKVYDAGVPRNISRDQTAMTHIEDIREFKPTSSTSSAVEAEAQDHQISFVDTSRIDELRAVNSPSYDLRKLIQLCQEINICFAEGCYLAVAMLLRAIIDHVPPIFGCNSFGMVVNNYAGSRSFKEQMKHLNESLRKIADAHLHTHVRGRETLPNRTQVNFAADVDVLLAEIIRILG